jgi:hypothetical protein
MERDLFITIGILRCGSWIQMYWFSWFYAVNIVDVDSLCGEIVITFHR